MHLCDENLFCVFWKLKNSYYSLKISSKVFPTVNLQQSISCILSPTLKSLTYIIISTSFNCQYNYWTASSQLQYYPSVPSRTSHFSIMLTSLLWQKLCCISFESWFLFCQPKNFQKKKWQILTKFVLAVPLHFLRLHKSFVHSSALNS